MLERAYGRARSAGRMERILNAGEGRGERRRKNEFACNGSRSTRRMARCSASAPAAGRHAASTPPSSGSALVLIVAVAGAFFAMALIAYVGARRWSAGRAASAGRPVRPSTHRRRGRASGCAPSTSGMQAIETYVTSSNSRLAREIEELREAATTRSSADRGAKDERSHDDHHRWRASAWARAQHRALRGAQGLAGLARG